MQVEGVQVRIQIRKNTWIDDLAIIAQVLKQEYTVRTTLMRTFKPDQSHQAF